MAYYCGDCVTWINSEAGDRYGRKYCDYSGRYEEKNQNIYGCRGFVWARRSIITKVCEILECNPIVYFGAFDDTKEMYLVPSCIDKLIDYNTVGPMVASCMEEYPEKKRLAENMLNGYIIPASKKAIEGDYQEAVSIYERMVKVLALLFNVTKAQLEEPKIDSNFIKILEKPCVL